MSVFGLRNLGGLKVIVVGSCKGPTTHLQMPRVYKCGVARPEEFIPVAAGDDDSVRDFPQPALTEADLGVLPLLFARDELRAVRIMRVEHHSRGPRDLYAPTLLFDLLAFIWAVRHSSHSLLWAAHHFRSARLLFDLLITYAV